MNLEVELNSPIGQIIVTAVSRILCVLCSKAYTFCYSLRGSQATVTLETETQLIMRADNCHTSLKNIMCTLYIGTYIFSTHFMAVCVMVLEIMTLMYS